MRANGIAAVSGLSSPFHHFTKAHAPGIFRAPLGLNVGRVVAKLFHAPLAVDRDAVRALNEGPRPAHIGSLTRLEAYDVIEAKPLA
jgi:hypothetical protein